MSHDRRLPARAAAAATLVALTGCASIPDVAVNYRPVRWVAAVAVTHTITCLNSEKVAFVDRAAAVVPGYQAQTRPDVSYSIRFKDLDGWLADSDLKVVLTDDGRLKSINQWTQGQGEAAVKALVGVAAAGASKAKVDGSEGEKICGVVKQWNTAAAGRPPQVVVVQTARLDAPAQVTAKAASADVQALIDALASVGQSLVTTVRGELQTIERQPIATPRTTVAAGEVAVTLQRSRDLVITVSNDGVDIGSSVTIAVPQSETFVLPIPKAALFGKQTFELSLADSGRIVGMGYGRSSGAAGALNAGAALAGASTTIDEAEAKALKAIADIAANKQRIEQCMADVTKCK